MIPTGPPPSDVPEPPERPRPIIFGGKPPEPWVAAMEEIEELKREAARLRDRLKALKVRVSALELAPRAD